MRTMTTKQQNEIVKLYAEAIEIEGSQDLWYEQLVTFRETFGDSIPDWRSKLLSYATKKGLSHAISAIEEYDRREMIETPPPEPPMQVIHEIRKTQYGYSSKTDEEIEAEIKAFHERQMNYVLSMAVLDQMYRDEKIDLEGYYSLQEIFSNFYGFTEGSLFWWNGPHLVESTTEIHRRNKTYTKRNKEYWDKYGKKPHPNKE